LWTGRYIGPTAKEVGILMETFTTAAAPLVPDSYVHRQIGDCDCGVRVLHAPDRGAYRWPVFAQDHR
jgi:hypothetical protein